MQQARLLADGWILPASTDNSLVDWYGRQLSSRPVLTKSLTSAATSALGDALCQSLFGDGTITIDTTRLLNQTLLGGVLVGPVLHCW